MADLLAQTGRDARYRSQPEPRAGYGTGSGDECVEVAVTHQIHVRYSKDATRVPLAVSPTTWSESVAFAARRQRQGPRQACACEGPRASPLARHVRQPWRRARRTPAPVWTGAAVNVRPMRGSVRDGGRLPGRAVGTACAARTPPSPA
ncbi:DUF397 domain-containing protein [Streptomyces sp. NPDC001356]